MLVNILANLDYNKILTLGNLNYIYEGENLSTNLIITIHSSLLIYDFYLEFNCPDDSVYSTDKLIPDTNDRINYALPYETLKSKGRLKIQIVARTEENVIFKSSVACLDIRDSICADQALANDFEDVIVKCINERERCSLSTDSCIDATNEVLAIKSNAQEAYDIANQSQEIFNGVIEGANQAINECNTTILQANTTIENCDKIISDANQAIEDCDIATETSISSTSLMDNLYNEINTKLQNGELTGKDAYKFASESGFLGSEQEFSAYIAKIDRFAEKDQIDDKYTNVITKQFVGKRAELDYSRAEKNLISFKIRSDKTIPQLPTEYISNYSLPCDKNLKIDILNTNDEVIKRIEHLLPYPLYAIDGATDSIEWDDTLKRYCVIYRTRCLELGDLEWSYHSNAEPSQYAYYSSFGVDCEADLNNPYYECPSLENYSDERLINQDISGISMLSNSDFIYIRLRISREICSDTSQINTLLNQEGHKLIYKLKAEEKIPLDAQVSDSILGIVTACPKSYINVYTADNQYLVSGEYYCDTRSYVDSKAHLMGDNEFIGNQIIDGDIEHKGNLYNYGDYITLRHNQEDNLSLAQGAGIKISGLPLEKQAIIRMNKTGSLYAGLEDNMKKVAYTFDSAEIDGGFLFWDELYGAFRSSQNYSKDSFLRQTITDKITLSIDSWQEDNNKYIYIISNNNIKDNSFVLVSYEDESKAIAQENGIANYNPVISNASLAIIADSLPSSDIELRLIIIGV